MFFEHDIFLSYSSSVDEQWLENFKKDLKVVYSQLLNKEVSFISSNDINGDPKDVFQSTSVFLAILDQAYLEDKAQMKLLESFHQTTSGKRIFKVFCSAVDGNEPQNLKDLVGYKFFGYSEEEKKEVLHDQFFRSEAERLFWLKLVDLAYAMYSEVKHDEKQNAKRKKVFVAETSADQEKNRDIIIRELLNHGYKVLPDRPYSNNKAEFELQTTDYLKSSDVAVHIMGEKYGEGLDRADNISTVDLQNKLAVDLTKSGSNQSLERIIWVSPEIKAFEEKQNIYLEQLKKDIDELEGAELVQTPLEVFKTIVRNKLKKKGLSGSGKDNGEQSARIYIISGEEDTVNIKDLEKWAEKSGYIILKSDFSKSRQQMLAYHRQCLAECDAVIIYYAHPNIQWLRMKLVDLIKAPGFGRKKALSVKAVYNATEDADAKELIKQYNILEINGAGEFTSQNLNEFAISLSKS